eukprot:3997545-Prymnesium_polylepis.1
MSGAPIAGGGTKRHCVRGPVGQHGPAHPERAGYARCSPTPGLRNLGACVLAPIGWRLRLE